MASKLAPYFISDADGSPVADPTKALIRKVGEVPVLGLDHFQGFVRAVGAPEDRTLEFIGSDETVDRYREVLKVAGWDLKNYKLNPVFLFGHNYREPSIGRSLKTWKDMSGEGKALRFLIQFAPPETFAFAETIYQLFLGKFMNASSVGFLPWDWEDQTVAEGDAKSPWRIYSKHELLELSAVPVPANPSALANAVSKGVIREADVTRLVRQYGMPEPQREVLSLTTFAPAIRAERAKAVRAIAPVPDAPDARPATETVECIGCGRIFSTDEPLRETFGGVCCEACPEIKGVIGFRAHGELAKKFPEGTAWNAPTARKNLLKWATSGESPNMGKYKQGFLWMESGKPDNVGSYLMPHHNILDGELAHHWRGSAAAMGVVLGARGGADIPEKDRRGCYNHLSSEYGVFEKEPPDFKEYLTAEDVLEGAKDGVTAYYLYCEVLDFVPPKSMPAVFLDKWPEITALDEPEPAPASPPAKAAERKCLVDFLRSAHSIWTADPAKAPRWILISPELMEAMAAKEGAVVEWHENGATDHLATQLIETAREAALGRTIIGLSEEDRLKAFQLTPEGDRVNRLAEPLVGPYTLELFGETLPPEAFEKAGAVLSKKNKERIIAAHKHLSDIIAEVSPPEEKPAEEEKKPPCDDEEEEPKKPKKEGEPTPSAEPKAAEAPPPDPAPEPLSVMSVAGLTADDIQELTDGFESVGQRVEHDAEREQLRIYAKKTEDAEPHPTGPDPTAKAVEPEPAAEGVLVMLDPEAGGPAPAAEAPVPEGELGDGVLILEVPEGKSTPAPTGPATEARGMTVTLDVEQLDQVVGDAFAEAMGILTGNVGRLPSKTAKQAQRPLPRRR